MLISVEKSRKLKHSQFSISPKTNNFILGRDSGIFFVFTGQNT